ncbi:MAG: transposase [Clostridium perfringens]|uniref:Transposase n=1 Tax=Clostridium perfringens TaxID=1502 RepID=A0AAW4ISH7_CLOPF|nr:transposase [Clostridium perfringens]MBO3354258.1 transposase [Clostridium perfringens]MBO3357528.1 transposase [Clostridium perfringens]MDU2319404.1 transposase [Clostridium perfringens]MDU7981313.1 transposase [Clostridium perfringens]
MKFQKIFVVIYALLLAFLIFSPIKLIGRSAIERGDIKLKVYYQAVTGATHYLKEDSKKLKKLLKDTYPEANTSLIKLVGNTPYDLVSDPAEIGSLTVYGKVTDITYEFSGDGAVPVFEVSYWDMPFKRLFLIQYHWFFIGMFVLFPIFIINAVILLKSYKIKKR